MVELLGVAFPRGQNPCRKVYEIGVNPRRFWVFFCDKNLRVGLDMLGLSRVSRCKSCGVDSGGAVASCARASTLEFLALRM